MNQRLSIIIATFNVSRTLEKALESVKNQTFQDWECIIVDGSSKDKTVDIIKKYVSIDLRFRYISEPDEGIYDAFNKGWKMAQGEWIYYLGADDELLPQAMSDIWDGNNYEKVDIVYGDMFFKTWRGIKHTISPESPSILRRKMLCSHQAMIMRKACIKEMGGFDQTYKILADYDLCLRAYLAGKRFIHKRVDIALFSCIGVSSSSSLRFTEGRRIKIQNHSLPLLLIYILSFKSRVKYEVLKFVKWIINAFK